jgi:hypothetical protein
LQASSTRYAFSSTGRSLSANGASGAQIFSGRRPVCDIALEFNVILAVHNHKHPSCPPSTHLAVSHGLDDHIWALMVECWNPLPDERPTACALRNLLTPALEPSCVREAANKDRQAGTVAGRSQTSAINVGIFESICNNQEETAFHCRSRL